VTLVIFHYHFRPGGIRRVIELATPPLVQTLQPAVRRVVLIAGETAQADWLAHFRAQLGGVPVELRVDPSLNYRSEQRRSPAQIRRRIHDAIERFLPDAHGRDSLVWAHNLGIGRNLILTRELVAACSARGIPLVAHHHDWWFDNRWARWPEMRRGGVRTLDAAARAVFPATTGVWHLAINRADAAILARHFPARSLWLPNLTAPAAPPPARRVRAAAGWLRRKRPAVAGPVWLLPCRALRRKNIAEALLLTRWLRPEAQLVVTGAASSADERAYCDTLVTAARRHQWPLQLGVLADPDPAKPTVAELLAHSEATLLTSVQEGFGLPYLEATAAGRPLIARRLPNIAPDLARMGFQFPQAYDEVMIAPECFDWPAERQRQRARFRVWRAGLPEAARPAATPPAWWSAPAPVPVAFSRLTLPAQLEVLTHPAAQSWNACRGLNSWLAAWRTRAARGQLRVAPWPVAADRWLAAPAYARRLARALRRAPIAPDPEFSPAAIQREFIRAKLQPENLYPILWTQHP
jgi:glycosyltransferase involved in cell wall biosynthesis